MDRRLQQEEYSFERLLDKAESTEYFFVILKKDYSFSFSFLRSWIRRTRNVHISRCMYLSYVIHLKRNTATVYRLNTQRTIACEQWLVSIYIK